MRTHFVGSVIPFFIFLVTSTVVPTASTQAQELTLADLPDKLVVQRRSVAGAFVADLSIGGTFTGPETIEARAVDADTGAGATPWTVVDAGPLEGIWTGVLPTIPQGGWYRVEVRPSSAPASSLTSSWRFGVGVVIATLGQSNMARMFTEDEADSSLPNPAEIPDDLTWRLGYGEPPGYEYARPPEDDIPVTWGPVTGSGGIRLANRLQSALGMPVLILDFALDWTGIDQHWNELGGPFVGWSRFTSALQQTGGAEAAVWLQGTYDAFTNPSLTAGQYRDGLELLHQRLSQATGTAGDLPIVVGLQNRGDYTRDTTLDASFAAVRQAQAEWIAEQPSVFAAGNTVDMDISTRTGTGQGHFWAANYQELGDRFATGAMQALGLSTEGVGGGEIESADIDGRVVQVVIRHDRGTHLSLPIAERDVEGFELSDSSWESAGLPIERAVLSSSGPANRVILVLGRDPVGPVRLRYLYGQNPNRLENERAARRGRGNWLFDDVEYQTGRSGLPIGGPANDLEVTPAGPRDLAPAALDDRAWVAIGGSTGIRVAGNDLDPEGFLDLGSVTVLTAPSRGSITGFDPATGTLTYQHDGSPQGDSFTYAIADSGGRTSATATVQIDLLDASFPALGSRVLHLESDRGLGVAVGGRITSWSDLSGRGNHLRAEGDPQLGVGGPNNRPAVLFDGVGDKLERTLDLAALPGGPADRSVFAVVNYRDTGFGGIAYGSTTEGASCAEAGNRTFGLVVDPSGDLTVQTWCSDLRSATPGTGVGWLSHSALVSNSLLRHYAGGQLIDLRDHPLATNSDGILMMGAEIDNNPYLPMDVAALLIYDRALSEPERLQVETYLQQKYLVAPGTQGPPVAADDLVIISRGETAEVLVLANDSADGFLDPRTVTLVSPPGAGAVAIDPDSGFLTYTHGGGDETQDQLTYVVSDTAGRTSDPATVTIQVLPFTLTTSGLVLHLESDRGLTADGSTVTGWADQTPNANDLGTMGNPSLIPGGPGGLAFIHLDGADDRLHRSGLTGLPGGGDDRSMFVVARYQSTGFGGVAYGSTSCDRVFGLIVDPVGQLTTQGWCSDFHTATGGTGTGWLTHGAVLEGGTLLQFRDGAPIGSHQTAFDTDAGASFMIGAEIDGQPAVAMDVAAVLVYDRVLGPAERLTVEGYLQSKFLGPSAPTPPPVAVDDQALVAMGGATVLDLLTNDLDDEGLDPASITLVSPPAQGLVTILGDGSARYQHQGETTTPDSFSYTVRDLRGQLSQPATVTITPQAPVLVTGSLVLHLEATTGVETTGDEVNLWQDQSGLGNDLFPGGNPKLRLEVPGRTFIRLDGGNDKLERLTGLSGFPGGSADRTLFTVVRYHGTGFGGVTYGSPQCNRVFGTVVDGAGAPTIQGWCQGNDFIAGAESATGQGWLLQAAVVESDTVSHYLDSDLIDFAEHTFDTDPMGRLRIGAEIDGQPFVEMDVGAVLLWDRALSDPERLAVEGYLRRAYIELPISAPEARDDFEAIAPAGQVTVPVLVNDLDDQGLDPSTLTVVTPPAAGTVLVDGAAGTLTYFHDGSAAPPIDSFTYTVANVAGLVSNPATVTVQVVDGSLITSGLVLHLETDAGVDTAGSVVTAWNDLSGHGNHLSASGDPTLMSNGLNGRDVVRFDGNGDLLQRITNLDGLPVGAADRSLFFVASYESAGFGGFSWGNPACNGVFGTVADNRGDLSIQGWCIGNDFSSPAPGNGAGWILQEAVLQADTLFHFVDGALVDTRVHHFATSENGKLVLGAEIDGGPFLRLDAAAVLVYDRALSATERLTVEQYLEEKYLGVPPAGGPGPQAVDDLAWVEPADQITADVLGNDSAPAGLDPLTVQIVEPPTHGSAVVDTLGNVTYTHGGDPAVADSFRYTVADLGGNVSPPATVFVTISPALPVTTGLVLHLETNSGTAPTLGDRIITWLDLSPRHNDVVAAGNPSLLAGGPGGRDFVAFDGAGDLLQNIDPLSGLPTGNSDRTLITLVRYRGNGFGGIAWGTDQCNGVFGAVVDNQGNLAVQGWCVGNDLFSGVSGNGAGWLIQGVTLESSQVSHFVDGVSIAEHRHEFDTSPGGELVIGAEIDGNPQVPMDLAAVLVFDRAIGESERQQLETYLRAKYGLP